jgi:hypothetical protein
MPTGISAQALAYQQPQFKHEIVRVALGSLQAHAGPHPCNPLVIAAAAQALAYQHPHLNKQTV